MWKNRHRTRKKFTYTQSLNLVRSLALAMNYLHQRWHNSISVVHRDLKPDNIGFTSNGILKVFDFGLCACIKSDLQNKESKYAMTGNTGTLRYMAPEVALGEYYNQSVDVYSFGIITWQIMKGKIPFEEMNKKTFFEKVVRGKFRPHIDHWWSKDLCKLLDSCWHHDHRKRPSFVEILCTLDLLIDNSKTRNICFCISSSIPVVYSNGFIYIDPEFIAKYRCRFLAIPAVLFLLGIICFYNVYGREGKLFFMGVSLVFTAACILYAIIYLSWEYWPILNLKSQTFPSGVRNVFFSFGEENVESKNGVDDEDDVYSANTRITSCNAGSSFVTTKTGNITASKESSTSLPMSSLRHAGALFNLAFIFLFDFIYS